MTEVTEEMIEEVITGLDDGDLHEMADGILAIEKQLKEDGPEDDDQLWMWVKLNLGIEIPRESVCEGHDSPFQFISDAYFNRYPSILAMGNRGGGKTFMVALLHWLNGEFKPGIESATFGATENQSLRCYSHLKSWIYDDDDNKRESIRSSVMRETKWRSGSKVEVLAGTPEAVNGPHPQVAHGDEVELMREDTWSESRNMAQSKTLSDGTVYPSQEILTSTRKGLQGRMQKLINGIEEAKRLDKIPDYHLIVWCIFEIAKEVPNCQRVSDKKREARLKELGEDPCSLCECDRHMKGRWMDTGEPRLLSDVCKGRLFRSRGYLPFEDVVQKFKQNSKGTWEAQQECSKPETEFNYLQGYEEERHTLREFDPDPANGPIYQVTDWGGTDPHSVTYYQHIDLDVQALDFFYEPVVVKGGTLVAFDEIYQSEIGIDALIKLVKMMEQKWRRIYPEWSVKARFADPQGKSQRSDYKAAGLQTIWKTTRDFDLQIEWLLREWWEEDLIRCCIARCEMWNEEAKSWQRDPKNPDKELESVLNHSMAGLRYVTANIRAINRRKGRGNSVPQTSGKRHRTATVVSDTRREISGPVQVRERGEMDQWRKRLGGPGL